MTESETVGPGPTSYRQLVDGDGLVLSLARWHPLTVHDGVMLLSGFDCGTGLAAIFFLGRSMWRVGRDFPVRISEHDFRVFSAGNALLKSAASTTASTSESGIE